MTTPRASLRAGDKGYTRLVAPCPLGARSTQSPRPVRVLELTRRLSASCRARHRDRPWPFFSFVSRVPTAPLGVGEAVGRRNTMEQAPPRQSRPHTRISIGGARQGSSQAFAFTNVFATAEARWFHGNLLPIAVGVSYAQWDARKSMASHVTSQNLTMLLKKHDLVHVTLYSVGRRQRSWQKVRPITRAVCGDDDHRVRLVAAHAPHTESVGVA